VRSEERYKLAIILIIGAFVEARSCERFVRIAPDQDDELFKFYRSLLKSEVCHYREYLDLAEHLIGRQVSNSRIHTIAEREQELIQTPDNEFRFHCGPLTV
jgi:tRNA-(ms[2]io[6]A)-hydroxylase